MIGLDLYLAHLSSLRFAGGWKAWARCCEHQLRSLAPEAKDYWTAITLRAGGGNDDAWPLHC